MNDKNAFEQVMAARWVTQTFNGLHQLQVDNLIVYGCLVFTHVKLDELEVTADMESRVVQYDLKTKKKLPPKAKKRIPALRASIHTLLGEDWDVRVIQGGKTIFGVQKSIAEKVNARRRANAGAESPPADE